MIDCSVSILTLRLTGVVQLIVGRLAFGQIVILVNGDFLGNGVVVGTVAGDVQLAVAINERQVTVTVESARVTRTQCNHVAMEHIVDRGGGIAEYRVDVGTRRHRTRLRVTAGKHGIVDDDTRLVQAAPPGGIGILVQQFVQIPNGHKLSGGIIVTTNGHGIHHLKHGFDKHLAVLGQRISSDITAILILIIITFAMRYSIVARASLLTDAEADFRFLVGAVHTADITAAEDVAVTVGHTGIRAYLAAVDMHLCLTEDVAGTVQRAYATQVVVAATAAKHIAVNVALVHLHHRLTRTVDALQRTAVHFAASDGRNLAAAEDTVAHHATVERHVGLIYGAVVDITAAKEIAGLYQQRVGRFLGFVFYLFNVFSGFIFITDVALIELHVGRAIHSTTLTAAIGIALDGGDAVGEAAAAEVADDHIGLGGNIVVRGALHLVRTCHWRADQAIVQTYISFPAAAIDITAGAALDIGRGTGGEAIAICACVIRTYRGKCIVHGSCCTGSIDILLHRATEQSYIGMSPYVAAEWRATRTITATVSIVHHLGTFVDDNVGVVNILALRLFFLRVSGVVSLVNLSLSHQRGAAQSGKSFEIVLKISAWRFGSRRVVMAQRPGIYPGAIPFGLIFRLQLATYYIALPA